jgi:hypothetical protein
MFVPKTACFFWKKNHKLPSEVEFVLSFSSLEVIFLGRFADDPEVVDPDSPAPETTPCFLFGCPEDPSVGGSIPP